MLAERFLTLFHELHRPVAIATSHSFDGRIATENSLILLGHVRAIPGEAPLTAMFNFQYRWDEAKRAGLIVNTTPHPGEESVYVQTYRGLRYSVVDFLPRSGAQGNVVILFGSNVDATDAAAEFVTSETQMAHLYQLLRLRQGAPIPSFELLLARPGHSEQLATIVAYRCPAGTGRK